ncbi:uncharacterized protein LOC125028336 [Penaeus chinensis]|uniref:uncharacterized protein LOC125028336 n=1 Tax=Penaeus chinensis TaxID=139456 RepID=UPI001FB80617|nr:uncharacterized protein LOC125028336 [Penaeus chinensis]XP_047473774.1 uncharacterized protein LOC125028336 [Penaeus chinensis]
MRGTWLILISLSLTCAESDFTLLSQEERAGIPTVYFTEVRKVSRQNAETDHSGDFPHRDHDVKVVLEDHEHFAGVKRWHLTFMRGEEQFTSTLAIEENVGSEQKEFVFPIEMVTDANAVFITARDEVGSSLAFGSSLIKIPEMNSFLAWVGTAYDPAASHLRVDPGTLPVVEIGHHICKQNMSPCYILKERLPEVVSRCLTLTDLVTDAPVLLCDETMIPFNGLTMGLTVEFTEDHTVLLSLEPPQDEVVKSIEVIAYHPRDPSSVFSPWDSQCDPLDAVGESGRIECSQNLRMTETPDGIEVVVVVFTSQNGSLPQSVQLTHWFITDDAEAQIGAIIIGSIIGGLVAVGLIVALVIFVRKNKNMSKGKREAAVTTSAHYTSAPTSDPEPAQYDDQI